ncbi:hypothetical protein ACC693_39390, partial [Rhizobium ruizarguesonis]
MPGGEIACADKDEHAFLAELASRFKTKAATLRAEGLAVEAIEIDLNRPDTIDAAASSIDERFGRLDI